MSNNILFVFEGEKTEEQILKSLNRFYLTEGNTIITTAYCTDIYNLYNKLNNDPDLDIFVLIKEIPINKARLDGITRDNISEIFLFFDYDGHATTASDEKIKSLLECFNEETEAGKLYLSYPMVEAMKHLKSCIPFKDVVVDGKNNINYKKIVHENHDTCFRDLSALQKAHWITILTEHCKKLNYLMTGDFNLPQSLFTQRHVFDMQLTKHIIPRGEVAVLSGFPIFVADYYGCNNLPTLLA